ncbi:hypothetical protein GQ53DRAFT_745189 [Thozetella sp. PMI_491]|nr:hypothetical protein GQ53DRAFT_745189 [Thozetella sp. PMI_491]
MPIRNPFARRPGITVSHDENAVPDAIDAPVDVAHPGFERVDTVGSRASLSLSIPSRKSQDTGEYKMSVVNDSGVYLPPSPTEMDSSWPRRYLSRTSTDTRSSTGEIEHFSISRESFDSYRRSFDICAKSPVIVTDQPRQSLDSRFPRLPRSALGERRFECEPPTPEEGFEDVGLNDDNAAKLGPAPQPPPQPKKRSFFKFGSEHQEAANGPAPTSQPMNMSRFLPGRKRDHSGSIQGSELGAMPVNGDRPGTALSAQEQEIQA